MSPALRIARLVSGAAALLTAAALVFPPALYFLLSYQHLAGSLEASAALGAYPVERIVAANPDLWEYEHVRIQEVLARLPHDGDPEHRRVLAARGAVVAENSDPLPWPVITRGVPLVDAGVPVGRLEASRSLRPVLASAALLALAVLPLCLFAFFTLRTAPLRAIERSEAELRRQRDAAQRYLDVAGVAFVILDRAGRVGLVNRKGAEILGRPEAEVAGADWIAAFVDPADRPRAEAGLASAASGGRTVELEYGVLRPGGERRIVTWYVTALSDDGEPTGLLASGIDVTTQRRLEARVGHAQKLEALGELASGVAHDFNNILSVINGYAHLLRRALPEGDARRSQVGEILAASDRAAALTDSLLTFSRRQEIRRDPLDLVEVLRDVQRFLRHLVRPDVEIRVELPGDPLPIQGDRVQLEQVLMNLVTNARDAMPGGGRISVSARPVEVDEERARRTGLAATGPHAELTVADTGTGMDPETQARLFEPFFTTKEPGKGTGLGLAIAYGIVKRHEGAIAVTSERGLGSTFAILIPLRAAALPVAPAPGAAAPAATPVAVG